MTEQDEAGGFGRLVGGRHPELGKRLALVGSGGGGFNPALVRVLVRPRDGGPGRRAGLGFVEALGGEG